MTENPKREFSGSASLADGTRVALTPEHAEAMWRAVEAATAKRAENIPTARDALSLLIDAEARMNELGWWRGGGLRVKRGDECAVAEQGSTGMWKGWFDADGKYVHYGDCCSDPRRVFLKPLADLTDAERQHMGQCDEREADAFRAMLDRLPSQEEPTP